MSGGAATRERPAQVWAFGYGAEHWALLERLELGVMLLDRTGRCLHRGRLFDELTAAAAATPAVRAAVQRFPEEMLARLRSCACEAHQHAGDVLSDGAALRSHRIDARPW